MANKAELLRFLDSRVFNPILRAKKKDYRESEQDALADVQGSTKRARRSDFTATIARRKSATTT